MIKLEKIDKIYNSKFNNDIYALNKINLIFSKSGMTTIVGESGCGKTSLLNIIGGLDVQSNGDYIFEGYKIQPCDLDGLRNNYIGFIFQDFNLINDLNVYDNLSLVCYNLKSEEIARKIKKVLEEVGLKNYEKRYPFELSGGEIQRIAIARALLKDYKVLLADEPTGNLNVEKSIEIFELLKKISKDKLVIVVTHNYELANKYADRIIHMKDGEIIGDTNETRSDFEDKFYLKELKQLPLSLILKMSYRNLFSKKFRYFLSVFSLVLLFTLLSISLSIINYNRSYTDYYNINSNEINNFYVQSYTTGDDEFSIKKAEQIVKDYNLDSIINGEIESSEELIKMGFELYENCLPLSEEGLYILDTSLLIYQHTGALFYDDLCQQEILKEEKLENLIGSYLLINEIVVRVEGIIKTKFEYNVNELTQFEKDLEKFKRNIEFFYKKNSVFEKVLISRYTSFSPSAFDMKLTINNKDISNDYFSYKNEYDSMIVFDDENVYFSDENKDFLKLNENEIYISLDLYNLIFNEYSPVEYYLGEDWFNKELIRKPVHIGENIDFSLTIDNNVIEFNDLIIKGIIVGSIHNSIYATFDELCEVFYNNIAETKLLVSTKSVKDLYEFIREIRKNYNVTIYYPYTKGINEFSDGLVMGKVIAYVVLVITFVIILSFSILSINQTVKQKDKENGILRSIGVSIKDIKKIYLFQLVFMVTVPFLFSVFFSYFGIKVMNIAIVHNYSANVHLLFFKFWIVLLIFIIIALITSFVLITSLKEALGKKVCDIIKRN